MFFRQIIPCFIVAVLLNADVLAVSDDVDAILLANPDPFELTDMKAVLDRYGPEGSGVKLQLGGIALQVENNKLVSNKTSIDGATNIERSANGFGFLVALSGDYLFEFDKYELNSASKEALAKVLNLYQEYDGNTIKIVGHTDSKGSQEYNQTLSEKRAESVHNWFIDNGISEEVLSYSGMGENDPVASNEIDGKDNPEGRALNRRVDINVTTTKKVNSLPTVSATSNIN